MSDICALNWAKAEDNVLLTATKDKPAKVHKQNIEYYLRSWEDSRSNKQYEALQFATMALPCFNMFRDIFYSNGKKVVPSNIDELLTDIGLAHWIMDDGVKRNKGLVLCTDSFSISDVVRLSNVLRIKYGLNTIITGFTNNKPRIYILPESMPNLIKLVKYYILKSFWYKLHLDANIY